MTRARKRHDLLAHEQNDLLRFTTAGSVDDGKSTLIGRLLHDSKGVYEDQLASVRKADAQPRRRARSTSRCSPTACAPSASRASPSTSPTATSPPPRRKFIIADTPGHEQYTRNMATGASTADLAIILIDARNGVLPQSRRHASSPRCWASRTSWWPSTRWTWWTSARTSSTPSASEFTRLRRRSLQLPRHAIHPHQRARGRQRRDAAARACPGTAGPALLEHLETVPIADDRDHRRDVALPGAVRDPARTWISAASPARSPPARSGRATR